MNLSQVCCLSVLSVTLVFAQKTKIPECHGAHDAKPCHCITKTEQTQQEAYLVCERGFKAGSKQFNNYVAEIPMHCEMVEHYGNWHTDANGDHDTPMPMQCLAACKRSRCKCDGDGAVCAFGGASVKEDK